MSNNQQIMGTLYSIKQLLPNYTSLVNSYNQVYEKLVSANKMNGLGRKFLISIGITLVVQWMIPSYNQFMYVIEQILSIFFAAGIFFLLTKFNRTRISSLEEDLELEQNRYNIFYNENLNLFTSIGYKYWSYEIIGYMMELMQTNRADSFRELMNLADNYIHRSNLEKQNQELLQSIDQLNRDVDAIKWNSYLNS